MGLRPMHADVREEEKGTRVLGVSQNQSEAQRENIAIKTGKQTKPIATIIEENNLR